MKFQTAFMQVIVQMDEDCVFVEKINAKTQIV